MTCEFRRGNPFLDDEEEDDNGSNSTGVTIEALQVNSITPPQGDVNVSPDNNIRIQFSKEMDNSVFGTVEFNSPSITYVNGVNCAMSFISTTNTNDTLVIDPNVDFVASASYSDMTIADFQALEEDEIVSFDYSSYNFTTTANITPFIVAFYPVTNSTGISSTTNIYVRFNKTMNNAVFGNWSIAAYMPKSYSNGVNSTMYFSSYTYPNDMLIINPDTNIGANVYWDISVNGFEDSFSNPMTAYSDINYNFKVVGLYASYSFTGNADDSSLNAYNGAVSNAVLATDRFSAAGSAYQFNGTNADIDLSPMDFIRDFTISVWIYPAVGGVELPIFSKSAQATPDHDWWAEVYLDYESDGRIRFVVGSATTNVFNDVISPASYPINNWHHIVVTCEQVGADHTMRLYVNNTYVNFRTASDARKPSFSNQPTEIGRYYRSGELLFNGRIDDINIYNYALTAAEIAALYTP